MSAPDVKRTGYTYGDYMTWPEAERWELIGGKAYPMMTSSPFPAPALRHQQTQAMLFFLLMQYFQGKPCQVLAAPVDVRLPQANESDEAVDTVVQPDLLVVCDRVKLDEKGVRGAPDLVVEILSASTAERDLGAKLRLYENHGVRCYLIADPWGQTLTVRYLQDNGRYNHPAIFAGSDSMPIEIFSGLELDLARVFPPEEANKG